MTIDEAIAHAREVSSGKFDDGVHCTRCYEFYEHLEELLEELKDYRDKNKVVVKIDCVNSDEFKDILVKTAKEQYNKAIDDCKSGIKEELERFKVKNLDTCVLYDLMDRKAEQLKVGVENEQCI